MERKRNKVLVHLIQILIAAVSLCGCSKRRSFFVGMSDKIQDIKIDSNFYFLKSFGLDFESKNILYKNYWKLHNDNNSYFKLSGFLRKVQDTIKILPDGFDDDHPAEYDLFILTEKQICHSWIAISKLEKNVLRGDSIVLSNVIYANKLDTIFNFTLYPFVYGRSNHKFEYYDPIFEVGVSRKNGVINIKSLSSNRRVFKYEAILFPKQLFFNRRGNLRDL